MTADLANSLLSPPPTKFNGEDNELAALAADKPGYIPGEASKAKRNAQDRTTVAAGSLGDVRWETKLYVDRVSARFFSWRSGGGSTGPGSGVRLGSALRTVRVRFGFRVQREDGGGGLLRISLSAQAALPFLAM